MNRDEFENKWDELKGKIQLRWAKLTSDDLADIKGSYRQLISRLEKKYGYSKEQAEQEVSNWSDSHYHSKNEVQNAWSEKNPLDDILAKEDMDPVYPFEPPQGNHKLDKNKDLKKKKGQ